MAGRHPHCTGAEALLPSVGTSDRASGDVRLAPLFVNREHLTFVLHLHLYIYIHIYASAINCRPHIVWFNQCSLRRV
jgi:hypothetical protein